MRTTFISSTTLWNSPRSSLDKLQVDLVKTNKELVTGRHADVGLALGYKTGQTLSLRQQRAELEALADSNASVAVRLKSTTTVLNQIREAADKFKDALIASPQNESSITILKDQAQANLKNLLANLNTNTNGQYIFGGLNTKDKPAQDYSTAAKTAVENAFKAPIPSGFGFPQNDPQVSTITPADMEAFLNGSFATLFNAANWDASWSDASDQNIQSLISPSEKIESSVNATEAPIKQLAMAYTMAFDLGISGLRDDTREFLVTKIIEKAGEAVTGLNSMQARLGTVQEKLEKADERMGLQKTILDEKIVNLEAVDPAEAKIRVDQLTTQIQTSYSLTAQLRQLSLINYL